MLRPMQWKKINKKNKIFAQNYSVLIYYSFLDDNGTSNAKQQKRMCDF